jgi:hypothetical protein
MELSGSDRLEFIAALGRPLRVGAPEELLVSDAERVRQWIAARDLAQLTSYWGYISFGHQIMLNIAYEWALRWTEWAGAQAASRALDVFKRGVSPSHPLLELLEKPQTVAELLSSPLNNRLTSLLLDPGLVLNAAERDDWDGALAAFEAAFAQARDFHDLLFEYSWAVMGVLPEERTTAGLHALLTASSFYEASWQQSRALSVEQNVALLAEHLRLHFSGPGREGSVRIVEEVDRYRLVLDPCGSGGAMRRKLRGRPGFTFLAESSPLSWGQTGSVPAYCGHCAVNELESLRRRGHLVWATEFLADADQPCGWTVFKSPEHVAPRYLERLSV